MENSNNNTSKGGANYNTLMISLISQTVKRKDINMANLSIPAIRQRLFNTSKNETSTQRSTNPFAASSFKGNVLTADVFESSAKKNAQPVFTGKLKASALVGSISGIGERFQNMVKSVTEFGMRIKDSVVNGWNKLNDIEISFAPAKEKLTGAYNSMKELLGTSVSDLLTTGVSAKSVAKMEDMTSARQLMQDAVTAWEAAV